jgi:hypothetical protein
MTNKRKAEIATFLSGISLVLKLPGNTAKTNADIAEQLSAISQELTADINNQPNKPPG